MCIQAIVSPALDLRGALQFARATGAVSRLLTVKKFPEWKTRKRFISANITQLPLAFKRRKQRLLRQ